MGKTIHNMPIIAQELTQCVQCGYCIDVCEAHNQTPWDSVTPRGKIYYLKQIDLMSFGKMDKMLGRPVELSPEFVDAMYKCTGCGNCEIVCHAQIHLVDLWETMRKWMVEIGIGPMPAAVAMGKSIHKNLCCRYREGCEGDAPLDYS